MDPMKRDPIKTWHFHKNIYSFLIFGIFVALNITACEPKVRERPYGDMRLIKVAEMTGDERYFSELGFLLRRDSGGFYVMSTVCTHDLTTLKRRSSPQGDIFVSSDSTSSYDINGKVLTGPAIGDLPYYSLKLESGVYGGPIDTLFVEVGEKVPSNWRFKVHMTEPELTSQN